MKKSSIVDYDTRHAELQVLRKKIIQAIRFSRRFWITYREGTFGIASIVNLIYKRSFIEVLFFPNSDVIQKGTPLLKIFTPLEEEIDFGEILIDPDFDEDGLVSPKKIISRMRRLIRKKFQEHLAVLDHEVRLIDEHYENYPIENNPYNREIRVSFPQFNIKLQVNFERYPLQPIISFSKTLSKILSERDLNNQEIIKNWDLLKAPHVFELIDLISNLISNKLQINKLPKYSQFLRLNNVSLESGLKDVSMKVLRGKSIGIVYGGSKEQAKIHQIDLLNLFEAIRGNYNDFTGTLDIFGIAVQLIPKEIIESIFIIPEAYDAKIQTMKIKKAVRYDISIQDELNRKKREISKIPHLDLAAEDLLGDFLTGGLKPLRKKKYIKNALRVTNLLNKKDKKFNDLTPLEFFQFSIARALIQSPTIIMFSIPPDLLGKFDFDKFNVLVNKIKKEYHLILIMHGPETVITECDKILTLGEGITKIATIDEYINNMPSSGEVLTLELNDPSREEMEKFFDLQQEILIVEERKNEKYKIFIKEDFNQILVNLIKLFGSSLFSFKKKQATLSECIQYMNYNK